MSYQEQLSACAAQGYQTNAAGTAGGVEAGIAFLMRFEEDALDMSVNIPEKRLDKLRSRLSAAEGGADIAVLPYGFGIRITRPGLGAMPPETLIRFLQSAAAEAAALAGVSYTHAYEKDREPAAAYIRGFFGALLGALAGILPWVLVTNLVHIQFGYLGFLISIGSFYGYCRFRGAHSTRYAVTLIVLFSLGVMFLPDGIRNIIWAYQSGEFPSFGAILAYSFHPSSLVAMLPGLGFGLLSNILGLLSIRGRVLSYTHEPGFLRRPRKPRG